MNALSPSTVAAYFIGKHKDDPNLTPMKLIKIVYIAHGWHLAIYNTPLIDEEPCAWKFGPVIKSLYSKYKSFKGNKIEYDNSPIPDLGDLEIFLERIWTVYGKYDGGTLSGKTHQPGTPWSIIWENAIENPFDTSLRIPNELIKSHYKDLMQPA